MAGAQSVGVGLVQVDVLRHHQDDAEVAPKAQECPVQSNFLTPTALPQLLHMFMNAQAM